MGLLKRPGAIALVLAVATASAEPVSKEPLHEIKDRHCRSTAEYAKTLAYLRETDVFTFNETLARKIADGVSKGCDGASERFKIVLVLLKTIGLSERKSVELALELSAQTPEVQRNFVEIFTNAFLAEFYDFDLPNSMKVALELSRDYRGSPAIAREDFLELVRFCKTSKSLELPIRVCADYMVKIAKTSQYYPTGVAKPFTELVTALRDRKDIGLDIKTTLKVAYEVLKSGPLAAKNFFEAFDLAKKELEYDKRNALEFAIHLSSRSFVGAEPPIMHGPAAVEAAQAER